MEAGAPVIVTILETLSTFTPPCVTMGIRSLVVWKKAAWRLCSGIVTRCGEIALKWSEWPGASCSSRRQAITLDMLAAVVVFMRRLGSPFNSIRGKTALYGGASSVRAPGVRRSMWPRTCG